jgi:hypothetical protein
MQAGYICVAEIDAQSKQHIRPVLKQAYHRPASHQWGPPVLQAVARRSLFEIFGNVLQPLGWGCAIDKGKGNASPGCLLPATLSHLYIDKL